MVWASHHFKDHLRGQKLILFTDHKPLQTCPDLLANQTLTELQQLALDSDRVIQHKKGINMPVDFLSQSNTTLSVNAIQLTARDLADQQGNTGSQRIQSFRELAFASAFLQPTCDATVGTQLHYRRPLALLHQNHAKRPIQNFSASTIMPSQRPHA